MDSPENNFKTEIASELEAILSYWKKFGLDEENDGFVGQRDHYNREIKNSAKGIILNTRILWTFSAVGIFKEDQSLKKYAERAFIYLKENFQDKKYGGVFWELNYKGEPINTRKQIYAQAFAIYALSEYYLFSGDVSARNWALSLFELIEKHARDKVRNGYFEAFQEDWSPLEDMRLSEKDRNSAKTMNTHLHILEAYTRLYAVTGASTVKTALDNLIRLFFLRFYLKDNQHFALFFNKDWEREGNVISYGHDIEAVWLLIEAAKVIENEDLLKKTVSTTLIVAEIFLREAYIPGAGVINEKNLDSGVVDTDRHWWPQAEAMVGLDYAYRISADDKFKEAVLDIWQFTSANIIDRKNGEWFFRIDENKKPYTGEDKLGMWKCPYHNSRACINLLR